MAGRRVYRAFNFTMGVANIAVAISALHNQLVAYFDADDFCRRATGYRNALAQGCTF